MAPPAVRRSLSVENTINQIDHYGLLRQQLAAKKAALASDAARERFHDRRDAFAEPDVGARHPFTLLAWRPSVARHGTHLVVAVRIPRHRHPPVLSAGRP